MLIVSLNVNRKHEAAEIKIVRREQDYTKLPHHFWYAYSAKVDTGEYFTGKVLHNYNSGAIALTARVTKAIVAQQKAKKKAQA